MSESQTPSSAASSSTSNFQSIFDAALNQYKKKTKNDLLAHRLTTQLETCGSPGAILAVLEEQYHVQDFIRSRSGDGGSNQWLNTTANVLFAFSGAIGEGVGLVFSPAKVIFAGVGVLLAAARDVSASQDAIVDLFERIENFFRRLETYAEVPPTHGMMDLIIKIMVEVLGILAIATKKIKERPAKKYLKKVLGKTDIEDALKRLDKLTHDEALMITAQVLKVAHNVDDKVKAVIEDGKEVNVVLRQAASDVDQIKRTQLRQDLRKWLSPTDPSTNHNIACDARHEGSAEWFFQGNIFKEWRSTGSLLWVYGKPGSGKSILCSTIIKGAIAQCDSGLAVVAYFYFDFRDTSKQKRQHLLPSLITQLSAQSDPYCDILSFLHRAHQDGGRQPSEGDMMKCLKSMVTLPDQPPVFLIMDALDECPDSSGMPSPREQVLDLLKELAKLDTSNLHLCVTSRPEVDIRDALEPLTSRRVSLHDQSGQKEDIIRYVTSVVYSDAKMRRWRDEDKKLVIETLSERADGMFRWIFCQLEVLRYCFPPSVRQMLEELPKTLDETYERILKEINKANQDHAHRLLQCLTVAARPLRVAELAEILAVDFRTATHGGMSKLNADWRWEDQERAVLTTCSSLITVVEEDGDQVVQFSHFSVKEYLTSPRLADSVTEFSQFRIHLNPAHTTLAKACLGTLLRLYEHDDESDVTVRFPLARYAARHWVDHAQFENVRFQVREEMEILFDPGKPHFSAWIHVHDVDVEPHYNSPFWDFAPSKKSPAAPLYYATLCEFHDLAEYLIVNHPHLVNAAGGWFVSPLMAALQQGDFKMAELLFQHSADIDVRGRVEQTPLIAASYDGILGVTHWLLSHGADPNIQEDTSNFDVGGTPLHSAVDGGHPEVTRLLLQYKADRNSHDVTSQIPLAVTEGQPNLTGLVPRHVVDVNARNMHGITALHLASRNGKLEFVRLLIDHGADIDMKDNEGRTAFDVAYTEEISKLLSETQSMVPRARSTSTHDLQV